MHALFDETLAPSVGERLTLAGDEARHALRVKRVKPGEAVLLLNGAGGVWRGCVEAVSKALTLRVEAALPAQPVKPAVRVFSPTPKGPRAGDLVDLLSQVGAASWTPLASARAAQRASADRLVRLERVAQAACKQCLRAWMLRLEAPATLAQALNAEAGEAVVLADQQAPIYAPSGADRIRLFIGPEGGWTEDERRLAREAGAMAASFGPHALRIESAAAVATAVVIHAAGAGTASGGE